MSLVRVQTEVFVWRYGWVWVLLPLCMLLAAAAYLVARHSVQQAIAAAQEVLKADRQRQQGSLIPSAPDRDRDRQTEIARTLAAQPGAVELTRQMAALARTEQITLPQGDYQYRFFSTTGITHTQVTQPVRASYPQLRRYISSVLQTIPNASLDQLAMKREGAGQRQVEARLKWGFWTLSGAGAEVEGPLPGADLRRKSP
jgi:ABC-type arginine transport system ATPase subunit